MEDVVHEGLKSDKRGTFLVVSTVLASIAAVVLISLSIPHFITVIRVISLIHSFAQ